MKINPIVNKILAQGGVLTGTYAWNYPDPKDVDVIFPAMLRPDLEIALGIPLPHDDGEYYEASVIWDPSYLSTNIIYLPFAEMPIWIWAGEKMGGLPPIPDKRKRHGMFEMFRAIYKLQG
jgi:hypothetical protein